MCHLALQNAPAEQGPDEFETPPNKARRDKSSIHEMLEAKTRQCLRILENRLAVIRAGETLLRATELIEHLVGRGSHHGVQEDMQEILVQRQKLSQHVLTLDGALDRRTSEFLFK